MSSLTEVGASVYINRNPYLTMLALPPAITRFDAAELEIHDDPLLPSCPLFAWADMRTAAGWSGRSDFSSDQACLGRLARRTGYSAGMMRSFVRRGVWLSIALAGCKPRPTPTPPAAPSHVKDKPVSIAGALPVAPFVAEELVKAGDARVVVYVGAKWCEPCQRFHDALHAGALDDALRGVRFVEYDLDLAKDALAADGYRPQLIPLFALPAPDGRAGDKKQEGSIKGEGALQNIMPRLRELLGR